MSQDERIPRLENAFATLAELAARSEDADTQRETRLDRLEESNGRITETNRDLAESNRLIVEMIRRHDERVGESRAARDETDQKLAAFADTQTRNEEAHGRGMEGLRAAPAELAEAMKRLAESRAHTDRRLDGLIDVVRDLPNGRG